MTSTSGPVWYESPLLASIGVPHAFSTRIGGVSTAPFDSLNLGNPSGCDIQDTSARIEQNYQLLMAAIGVGGREILKVHQVHASEVIVAPAATSATGGFPAWDSSCRADAIVTGEARHLASVRVADCVPVLLAASDGLAVAAVHAGWRGVVAGVVLRAIERLRTMQPGVQIRAAIGPCIGKDAFEVGPEVMDAFAAALGHEAPIAHRANGKGTIDLSASIVRQLQDAGIERKWIDTTDRCTVRDADEFFSHRRDNGITGRMSAMIGIKAESGE